MLARLKVLIQSGYTPSTNQPLSGQKEEFITFLPPVDKSHAVRYDSESYGSNNGRCAWTDPVTATNISLYLVTETESPIKNNLSTAVKAWNMLRYMKRIRLSDESALREFPGHNLTSGVNSYGMQFPGKIRHCQLKKLSVALYKCSWTE
ncbi:hypothetical protein IF1G_08993 [Cordyceps javanica]|uniref:Uncharacterized protein n=1 Tax=Cordyceps javanica TaxID=43265 RepID=A0A545USQ7_9HYPO|nr:hypothetical protein IF1G_08993 [Cordyceps javanica]